MTKTKAKLVPFAGQSGSIYWVRESIVKHYMSATLGGIKAFHVKVNESKEVVEIEYKTGYSNGHASIYAEKIDRINGGNQ